MKKFNVVVSFDAEIDFNDYIDNIVFNYKSPITAQKHYKELIKTLKELEKTADSFQIQTRRSITDIYGISVRRINFKKMAILYTIHEDTVYVLRIIAQSMISGL